MQFGFNNNCRWGFTFRVMQKTNLVSESRKFSILFWFCFYLQHKPTILDRIKWNSKPPSPQIKDEAARRAKTCHFLILDLMGEGGGGSRFSIYFVYDCSLPRSRLIGPGSVGSAWQYWVTPAQVATKKKNTNRIFNKPRTLVFKDLLQILHRKSTHQPSFTVH